MNPRILTMAAAAFWIAVNVYVTFTRTDRRWYRDTISSYLVGPGGYLLSSAFLVLASGFIALATTEPLLPAALFTIGGLGIAVAGVTKKLFKDEQAHLIGARAAYGCAGLGMIVASGWLWGTVTALAIAAAVGIAQLAVNEWRDDWTAMAERTVAAVMMAWIFVAGVHGL